MFLHKTYKNETKFWIYILFQKLRTNQFKEMRRDTGVMIAT